MYRYLPATKRVGGKVKRYKNLAAFNSECGKRSLRSMAACTATNLRCTKDGGGLATVQTVYYGPRYHPGAKMPRGSRPGGTWLLHFASCSIMKRHLKGRVEEARAGMLSGSRRRRRRR